MISFKPKKQSNTVRSMVREQYKEIANSAIGLKDAPAMPAAQLAARLNLSRNRVSVLERREVEGEITINQLRDLADKLGCELTYALVPKKRLMSC